MGGAADERDATAAAVATQAKDEPRPPVRGGALVEEATRVAATLNEKLPPLSEESRAPVNHRAAPERDRETRAREETTYAAHTAQPDGREESVAEPALESATGEPPAQEAGTRGRIGRRAATVGASVGGNLRPHVEKLREASTVVFDEATDDPGLRFLIVAVVLFLLFLFIFLFSYILG